MDFQVSYRVGTAGALSQGRDRTCLRLRFGWSCFSAHDLVKAQTQWFLLRPQYLCWWEQEPQLSSDIAEHATVMSLLFESGVFLLVRPKLAGVPPFAGQSPGPATGWVSLLWASTAPDASFSIRPHLNVPVFSLYFLSFFCPMPKLWAKSRQHDLFDFF